MLVPTSQSQSHRDTDQTSATIGSVWSGVDVWPGARCVGCGDGACDERRDDHHARCTPCSLPPLAWYILLRSASTGEPRSLRRRPACRAQLLVLPALLPRCRRRVWIVRDVCCWMSRGSPLHPTRARTSVGWTSRTTSTSSRLAAPGPGPYPNASKPRLLARPGDTGHKSATVSSHAKVILPAGLPLSGTLLLVTPGLVQPPHSPTIFGRVRV